MEDEKKTVMVAALSAYADLLVQQSARLSKDEGKGKGKAADDDVDLLAELERDMVLCRELTSSIADATSGDDIVHRMGTATGPRSPRQRSLYPGHSSGYLHDDESDINPFTNLPIVVETGYEPGPSTRPPAPLPRAAPPVASARARSGTAPQPWKDVSTTPAASSTLNIGFPLQPKALPEAGKRKTVPWNAKLAEPAPLRPFTAAMQPENRFASLALAPTSATAWNQDPDDQLSSRKTRYGQRIASMVSGIKGATGLGSLMTMGRWGGNRPAAQTAPAEPAVPVLLPSTSSASVPDNACVKAKSESDASTPISSNGSSTWSVVDTASTTSTPRLRRWSTVTSSTKTAGTTPARQSGLLTWLSSGRGPSHDVDGLQRELEDAPLYLSPLCLALEAKDDVFAPPPRASMPILALSPQRSRQDAAHVPASPPIPIPASPSSPSPVVSFAARSNPFSSLLESTEPAAAATYQHSIISAGEELTPNKPLLTPSIPSLSPSPSSVSPKEERTAEATTAKQTAVVDSSPPPPPPPPPPPLPPKTTKSVKTKSVTTKSETAAAETPAAETRTADTPLPYDTPPSYSQSMPHNPQSNDTVEADAALALALAHAEFRDVQMQRDRLLAYSIAHGTADDNDFELAYRLTQQMDDAIASFNAAVPSGSGHRDDDDMTAAGGFGASESTKASGVGGDSWMFWDDVEEASSAGVSRSLQDREQQQLSIDLCHALRAAEAEAEEGEEASLAAARRLQEQFDLEDRNDEGLFSEWKAANMEGCVACGDELLPDDLVRPPSCGHGFCDACLVAGFRAALASKTPFQCCGAEQRLAVGDCLSLPVGEKTQYEDMVLELTTPNPTYCSAAKCAAFVSPRFVIGDIATCQRCAARTCRHCNRPDHPGAFCKEDTETEAVKKLGLDKGWKTCPGCGHLIERTIGCLHMVCAKCQTAFCYRCSKRWRDCESTCPDALSATHPKKYVGP